MTPEQLARAERVAKELGADLEGISAATMLQPINPLLPGSRAFICAIALAIVRETPAPEPESETPLRNIVSALRSSVLTHDQLEAIVSVARSRMRELRHPDAT